MIRVTASDYATASAETKDAIIEAVFLDWRARGFPHYDLSQAQRQKEFNQILNYDTGSLISDGKIKQTLQAMGLCWHYFPHHWQIRTGRMLTPVDVWNDDQLLRKAVASRLKWGGYNIIGDQITITPASMRKAIRTYSGVQRVSNFRPTAAKAIYNYFDEVKDVWDMSSGFGGRLFGYLTSDARSYIGTDPSTETFNGLERIRDEWRIKGKAVELIKSGSEDFEPDPNSLDLCFTSPPYFSREKYSSDSAQSYLRYDSVISWNDNFLRKTLINCRTGLRSRGILALNVANVKEHPNLVADTQRIALELGFEELPTLQYGLSSIRNGGLKYEPILTFRKGN